MLNRREADGIIFLGHRLPTTLARILDRDGSRAPIVNGCEFTPSLGVSSAHIDNAGAAREVMESLYAMGHSDIALVLGPPDSPLTRDRLVGAQRAAEDHGLIGRLIVESGDFSVASCRSAATVLLSRSEEHTSELQSLMRNPYAVFC